MTANKILFNECCCNDSKFNLKSKSWSSKIHTIHKHVWFYPYISETLSNILSEGIPSYATIYAEPPSINFARDEEFLSNPIIRLSKISNCSHFTYGKDNDNYE